MKYQIDLCVCRDVSTHPMTPPIILPDRTALRPMFSLANPPVITENEDAFESSYISPHYNKHKEFERYQKLETHRIQIYRGRSAFHLNHNSTLLKTKLSHFLSSPYFKLFPCNQGFPAR